MQLPSVERNVNWPLSAAGSQSGGSAAAAKAETSAIQEATAKVEAVSKPEPSVKLDISTAVKEIVELEVAARARAQARVANPQDDANGVEAVGRIDSAGTTSALQSVNAAEESKNTGNSLQNESPETAAKAAKLLAAGKEPGPNQPTAVDDEPSTDWTTAPKAAEKKPENPPPEPISKKLLDFLQALWRAGGNAVDVAQEANKTLNPDKLAEGPLTYEDPSAVKKTSGI
nr:hypothetical protein [uncultured Albidiferax sp.]